MSLFAKTVPQGAATQVYVATAPEIDPEKDGGCYFSDCQKAIPSKYAQEPVVKENAKKLWNLSVKYVGL